MRITASAPTRLDFGGGWTDVPPYPEERGGFVVNLAIERRATVALDTDAGDPSVSGRPDSGDPVPEVVAAALRRAGVTARVALASDFPVGAGLGGSSACGVALAAALARLDPQRAVDPASLAEWSRATEVEELGVAGGFQDHYAAAFGGALALTLGTTRDVERIALPTSVAQRLERRCLLAFTGESRISAVTITAVLDAYRERDRRVVGALDRMATLARSMRDALAAGDVDLLASLVDEHWSYQRSLHPAITTDRIDALEHAARAAGAVGVKALGASGGGCVIVFAPEQDAEPVAEAVRAHATLLEWRVANDGVVVAEEP